MKWNEEFRPYELDAKAPPELIITIGLPASGKSTWAKDMVNRSARKLVRVNRDDLRAMCFDSQWTRQREEYIVDVEIDHVKRALTMGYSVIVDDTNLSKKTQDMWNLFSKQHIGLPVAAESFLSTPLCTCFERDRNREKRVGRNVIERMAFQYGLVPTSTIFRTVRDEVVIYDIDGTLADAEWRKPYARQEPKDWDTFFVGVVADAVRENVREMLLKDYYEGKLVIIVSGRPQTRKRNDGVVQDIGKETEYWLNKNNIPYHHFLQRNADDRRPDTVVKAEILEKYIMKVFPKENIVKVVDDRPSVIRMWKDHGLNVVDVGNGEEF